MRGSPPSLLLGTGTPGGALDGSNQRSEGGTVVVPCDTDTSKGGIGQPEGLREAKHGQLFLEERGIDGGEFKPPGLCPWGKGKDFSQAVSRIEGKFPFRTGRSSFF